MCDGPECHFAIDSWYLKYLNEADFSYRTTAFRDAFHEAGVLPSLAAACSPLVDQVKNGPQYAGWMRFCVFCNIFDVSNHLLLFIGRCLCRPKRHLFSFAQSAT
jgi:hypothetical protein